MNFYGTFQDGRGQFIDMGSLKDCENLKLQNMIFLLHEVQVLHVIELNYFNHICLIPYRVSCKQMS